MRNDIKELMGTVYENYCGGEYKKKWTTNMKIIKLWQIIKDKLQVPQKSFLAREEKVFFNFHQPLLSNLCLWLITFMFCDQILA